jgi:hypothetical protein
MFLKVGCLRESFVTSLEGAPVWLEARVDPEVVFKVTSLPELLAALDALIK